MCGPVTCILAIGDRHGAGIAWNNLARTWEVSGRTAEAVEAYGSALELEREFGDWFGAGRTLNNLARVHAATGDPARARAAPPSRQPTPTPGPGPRRRPRSANPAQTH